MQEKLKRAKKQKQIQTIQLDIIKYQLSDFCKRNSKALALIFKALLKGEKTAKQNQESTSKDKPKKSPKSTPNPQPNSPESIPNPTQESTIHLKELDLDIPAPKPPLNIEG